MELKLRSTGGALPERCLLIVPYGIEIDASYQSTRKVQMLLIVPYGIEITHEAGDRTA